jgi:hypothetical protein
MMETGLFEIESGRQIDPPDADQLDLPSRDAVRVPFAQTEPINLPAHRGIKNNAVAWHAGPPPSYEPGRWRRA